MAGRVSCVSSPVMVAAPVRFLFFYFPNFMVWAFCGVHRIVHASVANAACGHPTARSISAYKVVSTASARVRMGCYLRVSAFRHVCYRRV